jgi:type I restriction enzyme S subunit
MQKIELHKVCKIGNGFAFKSEDYLETGIPLLRISNINNGIVNFKDDTICVAENYLETKKDFIVEKGDVVIALSGATTGKYGIYISNEPALLNQRIGIIKSNVSKKLDSKYFYFYLNILKDEILRKAGGAAQPNISTKEIGNLQIPLPNLPTQQKIATILDKADELRQYNKQLIEKYDALIHSLFLDIFGDPVRNEKGWKKLELKKFGKIITGNTPPRNDDENYSSNFIEWLKTDNINDKYVNVTQAKEYLSEKGFSKARFVENGALLVACIAGSIESIGRASLTDRKVSFNQQINAIQPFDDVNPKYLYNLFKISKKHIQNHASNGMKRMLTKGEFEKILMIKPTLELQNQFAERVQLIETQKQQAQEALAKSEDLFQGLLQRAFKGELN